MMVHILYDLAAAVMVCRQRLLVLTLPWVVACLYHHCTKGKPIAHQATCCWPHDATGLIAL
jgi:hypothetical protein